MSLLTCEGLGTAPGATTEGVLHHSAVVPGSIGSGRGPRRDHPGRQAGGRRRQPRHLATEDH